MKKYSCLLISIILMLSFLINCSQNDYQQQRITEINSFTNSPIIDKATRTVTMSTPPTKTILLASTTAKFPTNKLQVVQDPTDPWFPTLTPLPKLQSEAAKQRIIDLYKNNNDCKLPCWWGITPGVTTWEEAKQLLYTVAYKISDHYGDELTRPFKVYVIFPYIEALADGMFTHYYFIDKGKVVMIDLFVGNAPFYSLPNILIEYGLPTDVWILTFPPGSPMAKENAIPFSIELIYKNKGILASFDIYGYQHGNIIKACPGNNPAIGLTLWNPDSALEYVEEKLYSKATLGYQSLYDATGITLEEFYSLMKNSSTKNCIKTDWTLWHD